MSDEIQVPPEITSLKFDQPGLEFIVLHGSGARGARHALSDWDFAFVGTPRLDIEGLRLDLSRVLDSDDVDLADLSSASGLLRYRVAREGRLLFEARPDLFQEFRIVASRFWCDIEPVVRRSHEHLLASLKG